MAHKGSKIFRYIMIQPAETLACTTAIGPCFQNARRLQVATTEIQVQSTYINMT